MSKYVYNKDYFEKINTSEKAYWLGFHMQMDVLQDFIREKY